MQIGYWEVLFSFYNIKEFLDCHNEHGAWLYIGSVFNLNNIQTYYVIATVTANSVNFLSYAKILMIVTSLLGLACICLTVAVLIIV